MPQERTRTSIWPLVGGTALLAVLVWGGFQAAVPPTLSHPLVELLKLVSAFVIGLVVTAVHRRTHTGAPLSVSLGQAQVLLCVSGALLMLVIGESLARAFGIAGAASIIRFRTPVDDPKDAIILFLLLGLGMSCGLGAFAVAGLGAAFLCIALWYLAISERTQPRAMNLAISAVGDRFPSDHVHDVLDRHGIQYETREITNGAEAGVRYRVLLDESTSLDNLNEELRSGGSSGIKAVVWEKAKKQQ